MQQTLNARQDGCDVIGWRPSVLQNIEAQFSVGVDIGVEHLAEEFDGGWLVRVGFVERENEFEGSVFERGVCGTEDDSVPDHEIVGARSTGDASRRISRETFEVSNETLL